jgi:hypothetical protein
MDSDVTAEVYFVRKAALRFGLCESCPQILMPWVAVERDETGRRFRQQTKKYFVKVVACDAITTNGH